MLLAGALTCAGATSAASAHAAPALNWTGPHEVDTHSPTALSCPSSGLCVAVDRSGYELSSTNPTVKAPAWSAPAPIDAGHVLSSVSCASPTSCAAVDDAGNVLASANPSAGSGSWHSTGVDSGSALNAISCASDALCVTVDSAGNAIAVNPANLGASPIESNIDASNAIDAISCPSVTLCVAGDDQGNVLVSTNPGAQSPSWRFRTVTPDLALVAISCLPAGLCIALDGQGDALVSNNPAVDTPTWSSTQIDTTAAPTSASCTSSGLCVVVDAGGRALASDDPTDAPPSWIGTSVDSFGVAIEGISCLPEGFCIAIDSSGRVLSATVPAPLVSIASASGLTQTDATLSGIVNPNDALISECVFEYGTSGFYGASMPCASLPTTSSAPGAVSAQLTGLEPGATYHYRLRASSGAGVGLSEDLTFTTVAEPTVSIVKPHPSISGVPAVGLRLRCNSGVSSEDTATLKYAWVRDAKRISGATGSSYLVKSADAKHHLQCTVTATNVAGSASASSAFVSIPAQGIVAAAGETLVGKATAAGSQVSVPLTCSAQSVGSCQITLRLTVVETLRGSKIVGLAARRGARKLRSKQVTVTVAKSTVQLTPGQHSVLALALNPAGRRLLSHAHRLPVLLAVSGTVIGSIKASLASQRLTLTGTSHSSRRSASASH